MTTKHLTIIGIVILVLGSRAVAAPLGTAFTYQGRLLSGASAVNGNFDLKFSLHDAASSGAQVGNSVTNTATTVSNGLFTVTLDFGNGFDGSGRWLEIGVRTNGSGGFTTLAPRQAVNPSLYALYAPSASAVAAANIIGSLFIGAVSTAQRLGDE